MSGICERCEQLENALWSLLDGLDSNTDELGGLLQEEWDRRIAKARAVLDGEEMEEKGKAKAEKEKP